MVFKFPFIKAVTLLTCIRCVALRIPFGTLNTETTSSPCGWNRKYCSLLSPRCEVWKRWKTLSTKVFLIFLCLQTNKKNEVPSSKLLLHASRAPDWKLSIGSVCSKNRHIYLKILQFTFHQRIKISWSVSKRNVRFLHIVGNAFRKYTVPFSGNYNTLLSLLHYSAPPVVTVLSSKLVCPSVTFALNAGFTTIH